METPAIREDSGRNPDGTFKPGVSGNPSGRPKNTLKDYIRRKLDKMTDEEKEAWLAEHKISGIDMWKMAEGNPAQGLEGPDGEAILVLPATLITKNDSASSTGGDSTGQA